MVTAEAINREEHTCNCSS